MSGFADFIATIIGALSDGRCAYVVTGSFASTYYSEPRTTMDIDVVVQADLADLERFRTAMIEVNAASLDCEYLRSWGERLGVNERLERLLRSVDL